MTGVKELRLRPHQEAALSSTRHHMATGARRVCLSAPTAFGKTETSLAIVKSAEAKGSRVWFIVDRVTLVQQTSDKFNEYGVDHGVIQGDHPGHAPDKLIQIVSAQTLAQRRFREEQLPHLVIWDECHSQYKSVLDLIENTPSTKAIGLTATPFSDGMADAWDALVNGATVNQLLAAGFLTPLRIKTCVAPDMKDAKRIKGEYELSDAGDRGITIIGDVVQTWVQQTQREFGGPVKTIVNSPSVKHGAELCRQFATAGYNFQQISYLDKSDADRKAKIDEFRKPDSAIHGLVSCAVLTKGFDVPDVRCGISCRPYRKSFSSHIQELGRVMRLAEGKEFGLWLDHSGNCISFAEDTAWLFEHGVDSLSSAERKDSEAREPTERAKKDHFCGDCGTQMAPAADTCSACGWQRPQRGELRVVEGKLIDFKHDLKGAFKPRAGLRSDCLADPIAVWNAALTFCMVKTRKGEEHARKWAYGIWAGVYPQSKLPRGMYELQHDASRVSPSEWSLVEREVDRFRKTARKRVAA